MPPENKFFTKKFTADFNTSADSLSQIATHEWNIDMKFVEIYSNGLQKEDFPAIKALYYLITKVYADRLYAIMWHITQEECADKEAKLEEMYNNWVINHKNEIPTGLFEAMRKYKRWLYEIKQKTIKMGIPTKIEMSAAEATKKAIEG